MLSMGIKNSILILIIVFILHFAIKNAIVDRRIREDRDRPREKVAVPVKPAPVVEEFKSASKGSTPAPVEKEAAVPCKEKESADSKQELLDFVYGDSDDSDLGKFFKGTDITKEVQREIDAKMSCPVLKTDDHSLPLSTTCDPGLQNLAAVAASKRVKYDCDLPQTLATMTLKEYENENAMNGGELYGNLSAFDNGALSYEPYACAKHT